MNDKFEREISPWICNLMSFNSVEELKKNLFSGFKGFFSLPKKIAIIGASSLVGGLIDELFEKGIIVDSIFDHNIKKHGTIFKNIQIRPFEEIATLESDIPLLLGTHRLTNLYKILKKMGFQHIWPFPLFYFYDVHFKPHPFYKGLLEDLFKNRENIQWLYKALFDKKSKRILDAIVGFRLTFNPELLDELIDPFPYFSKDIFNFGNEEVLIDGGAYNGDSIRLFKEVTSDKFKRIISFEPSTTIFKTLKKTFYNDYRIIPTNACLFSENTTLLFDDTEERGSAISISRGKKCQAVNIDSIPYADDITFIKLNIEGAEPDAISGAARTIRERKPGLAVAVYHRPDHLWSLAKHIRRINSDYRLYLRQHDGGIIETVLYAI